MLTYSERGKLGFLASIETQRILHAQRNAQKEEAYALAPRNCLYCHNVIPYDKRKNKYCNHRCAITVANKRRKKPRPILTCATCAAEFTQDVPCRVAVHCKTCRKSNKKKTKLEDCRDPRTARRCLIARDGNRCTVCGTTEWCGKVIPLVLDHINGNSDDWSTVNLRMICPNCDAQTDTYKGKNKGNGRHYRRLRYKEGKSY